MSYSPLRFSGVLYFTGHHLTRRGATATTTAALPRACARHLAPTVFHQKKTPARRRGMGGQTAGTDRPTAKGRLMKKKHDTG